MRILPPAWPVRTWQRADLRLNRQGSIDDALCGGARERPPFFSLAMPDRVQQNPACTGLDGIKSGLQMSVLYSMVQRMTGRHCGFAAGEARCR